MGSYQKLRWYHVSSFLGGVPPRVWVLIAIFIASASIAFWAHVTKFDITKPGFLQMRPMIITIGAPKTIEVTVEQAAAVDKRIKDLEQEIQVLNQRLHHIDKLNDEYRKKGFVCS
jgi:hypothetical protein